jgi:hypothetical protein
MVLIQEFIDSLSFERKYETDEYIKLIKEAIELLEREL